MTENEGGTGPRADGRGSSRGAGRGSGPSGVGPAAHTPLGGCEARLMRLLAAATRDDGAIAAATSRCRVLREAMGLGIGFDPDVIEGLDRALEVLPLIRAARRDRTSMPSPSRPGPPHAAWRG